ncbi:Hemicentin-1 [Desmophyllum pertusum]|uniref:Hemicentin-1 n=1 Tax=Desmophyllum pertusum TaxID=174260 RepID=A0A9W9YG88_9CNID|nr:Hemicentin-1 [Desmophyllum pertusum]
MNLKQTCFRLLSNVSQKELLKLEGDIKSALNFARVWNLSQHEEHNPGKKYQISLEQQGEKHQQILNRNNEKQEQFSEEQLKHQQQQQHQQQQLHKLHTLKQMLEMFRHPKPNVALQQKQTQRKNNQTDRQVKDNNIGTTLRQHQPKQSNLQETNHLRYHLKKMNMSYSTDSSTTVENCTSPVPVNTTNRHHNYGCSNGSADSFPHSFDTSHVNVSTLNKTNLHVNSSHSSAFARLSLAHHRSASKMTGNNTSPLRTRNSTVVTRPSLNAALDIELDRDSPQGMDAESVSEGQIGSGIIEMTEFVDQGADRKTLITKWSEWGPCPESCGVHATRKRIQYRCTSSSQKISDCAVSGEQQEACVLKPCPEDGRFSSWSQWRKCSRSCGVIGVIVRTRSCTPPKYGGQQCYGAGIATRPCNRKHCPVNGGLSEWSKFGLCSKSCGGGARMRRRNCNSPVPRYGGKECDPRDLFETQTCGNIKCPVKTLKRMDSLYSRIPEVICNYNPCLSERCWEIRNQCAVDLKCRPVFIGIDRRSIPPQCQVHGTVRVDRPSTKQVSVNLASDLMPSFTRLWYPTAPSLRMLQFQRVRYANNYPMAFPTVSNTYSSIANRKQAVLAVQPLEQRPVTEVITEKLPNNVYGDDDDNDNDDNDVDDDDDDNFNEEDDDGAVHTDIEEDSYY